MFDDRIRTCERCGRRYVWDWRRGHTHRICNSSAGRSFTIAGGHTRSRERLLAEIKKCVLLCSNCHREVEAGVTEIPPDVRTRVEKALVGVSRKPVRRMGRPAFNDPE